MSHVQQDQLIVATAEAMERADDSAFYLIQFLEYVQRGDSTAARRSLLKAEGALIHTKCAWRLLEELTAPAKGIAA